MFRKLFKKLFRRPDTQYDLRVLFMEKMLKLTKADKVEIQHASYPGLQEAVNDPNAFVYLLIIKTRKFKQPKPIKDWFKNYTSE